MRKVWLSMEEQNDYEVIKKLVETNGNKVTARIKLGYSEKTINRMIAGYKEMGKEFFVHGNTGRKPVHAIPEDTKLLVLDLYRNKYYDANFVHFTELLETKENIDISESVVRTILMKENILSPKANKATKKRVKTLLEERQKQSGLNVEEKKQIAETIIAIEDSHPRRPRSAYFGELIQMDASLHQWFGDFKCQLHIAIDDCTGNIVGGHFDKEETLEGYYNILHQLLVNYGIPYKFLTDKRTVFEYKKKSNPSIEDDTHTQFGYACKQLGIDIQCTSIPQAKGRVERMFGTLQSRLLVELRLAGVTDIQAANVFLNSYIKKYNKQFGLPVDRIKSVFEIQPSIEKINLTLAVISERKIDSGHCIRYNKKYYKTVDTNNNPVYHRKGTEALIIKSFNGELYATINEIVYALVEVPIRETVSKNFDILEEKSKQKTIYIPPMNHPWRQSSFKNYLKQQAHLKDISA